MKRVAEQFSQVCRLSLIFWKTFADRPLQISVTSAFVWFYLIIEGFPKILTEVCKADTNAQMLEIPVSNIKLCENCLTKTFNLLKRSVKIRILSVCLPIS